MKNFFIFLFILSTFNSFAQITFQRTYQHQTSAQANTLCKTLDGGFLMAGRTSDGINILYSDFYLVKTDSLGNVQWSKAYGGNKFEEALSVISLNNGGYVITGYTSSFSVDGNSDIFVVKIDDTGKILWQKLYGGYATEAPTQLKQTTDGGFVIIATYGPLVVSVRPYLVKIDSVGNLLWTKTYGAGYSATGGYVNQTKDGGYIITGSYTDTVTSPRYYSYAMKTDDSGNILWSKRYTHIPGLGAGINTTQAIADGGYILAGNTYILGPSNESIYLNKIDSLGNLQWAKLYDSPSLNEIYALTKGAKKDIMLCSDISVNNKDYITLMLIDSIGNLKYNKTIGRPGIDDGNYIEQINSSEYVIAGTTSTTLQSTLQFYLIKTDSLGNSGCNTDSVTFTTMDLNTIVDTLIFSTSSLDSFSISAFTITSYGGTDSILCFNNGSNAVHEIPVLQKEVSVFPNPTTGIINMEANGVINLVKITNAMGAIIYSSNPQKSKTLFDLSHKARGIYFYTVQMGDRRERGKILLE